MRNAVLLLCSVLIVGASAVAQTAPAAAPAGVSQATPVKAQKIVPAPPPALSETAAPPLHPLTDAQVREILQLTHANRLEKQAMATELRILPRVFPPYMPKDVMDDLKTSLENIDLDSIVIKIYQEHVSQEDAAAAIAFYKTPAGQHLLTAMPEIMMESRKAGAEAGRKVALEVLERHKAEIQAAAQKYKDLHWIPPAQPQN